MSHRTMIWTAGDGLSWAAYCDCGWTGRERWDVALAKLDREEHWRQIDRARGTDHMDDEPPRVP
jgi:hypothetical protein